MKIWSCSINPLTYVCLLSGGLPGNLSIGPPVKPSMEDSYSRYDLLPSSESPTSPVAVPDNWSRAKSENDKIANGSSINWPPGGYQMPQSQSEQSLTFEYGHSMKSQYMIFRIEK